MLPMNFQWNGEALAPMGRYKAEADKGFVIGSIYRMAEWSDRSRTSHNHEFAWLAEAWRNLPEQLADEYPTPEHLRKRALIAAGYYTETIVDCGTQANALRIAAYMRGKDGFSVVIVRRGIAIERVAESQSMHAMGKKRFQESKSAIMEIVASMIGVTPGDLQRNAGRAA